MLKKICFITILGLMFCTSAFATELDADSEATVTSEEEFDELVDGDNNGEMQAVDIKALEETVNEYEIEDFINSEENKFESNEETLFGDLEINGIISEGTIPASENIYLSIYNYLTQEMKYIKLNKNDDYKNKISIPYGQYLLSVYIYDDMDIISMDNMSAVISETPYTVNVNINGIKEEAFDKLVEEEIIEEPKEEAVKEENVEQEQPKDEHSIGDIIRDILYNNMLTFFLMAAAVIILGIKRYRDNNNKE